MKKRIYITKNGDKMIRKIPFSNRKTYIKNIDAIMINYYGATPYHKWR